jgi:hypothetical protein
MKQIHLLSGLILTLFIGLHLFNHFTSIWGIQKHIEVMNTLRLVYRNPYAESLLLMAAFVQITTGISLVKSHSKSTNFYFDKLHVWTGLYLVFFLAIHLSAVLWGRMMLNLDTNFYFGAAGLNTFPLNLLFIPYYGLAIISFFGHLAAIHYKKMLRSIGGVSPYTQSMIIFIVGIFTSISIIFGLTNHFEGITIPKEYHLLLGK